MESHITKPAPITVLALLSTLGVMILVKMAGLRLDHLAPVLAGVLLLAAGVGWAIGNGRWRYSTVARDALYGMVIFTVIALTGAVASYPIAAMSTGLYDAELLRIDTVMQFDWTHAYAFVADHPSLQILGVAAYRTIYVTPAILLTYWAFTGQQNRAQRFLLEFWCAAVVTLALFALMPAAGPLDYLWRGHMPYMPDSELCQPRLIEALRNGSASTIDFAELCGLVSAPSFHSVAAVLFFRSAFSVGRLKWLIIGLAGAMLASTPVEGTHYLIDIVLGIAVAVVTVGVIDLGARLIARGGGLGASKLKRLSAKAW